MSKSNSAPFLCDNCGATKTGDADTRWRVLIKIGLMPETGAAIYRWNDSIASLDCAHHACGDRCTLTLVERYLAQDGERSGVSA